MVREDPEKNRKRARAWALANPEKSKARSKAWRVANPEKAKADNQAWRVANRDKARASRRRWREMHPEAHSAAQAKYAAKHKDKYRALRMKRIADKAQRTPVWADLKKIEAIYAEAAVMTAMMGESWHVDHVIPLRGKNVSGLHVHGNLQLLPGTENVRKHNRYIVA